MNPFSTLLRVIALVACAQLALPAVGLADEEEKSRNFGSGYYEAPVISTLSNHGKGWDLGKELFGEDSKYDIGGWVQQGHYTESTGLFNKHEDGFRNQQSWLYFEKKVDGSEGFDLGGRVDAMYGTDSQDTQAFGNNRGRWDFTDSFDKGIYGFAIPQLFVEGAYKDITVKAGHFYTLLGYEVVPAPANFFYSHAFTMYLSEPFTHTGAVGTYTGIDKFTFYAGYTLGWDTGFDQNRGGSNFIGGFTYAPFDWLSGTYLMTGGDLGWIGSGYSHSIVITAKPFEHFTYVLLSDLTLIDNRGEDYNTGGIANYFLYQIMDEIGVGARGEWWQMNGIDYYEVTGGFNFKPLPNLLIRPEGRYQWGPGETAGANNPAGLPVNTGIFGIDVILTF